LKGKEEATASVPACLAVAASKIVETPWAGPLTVERAEDLLASLPLEGDLFAFGSEGFEGGIRSLSKNGLSRDHPRRRNDR
jgi:hypothetical protein